MEDQYKKNKHIFTVGIMTGSFHTDYSRMVVDAIGERFWDENIAFCLFQSFDASRYLSENTYMDESFDQHYYSMFEYSRFMAIDMLIISFGTVSAIPNPMGIHEFLARVPQVPVILLENETELENVIHITVDNYRGMKHCIEHLILVHNAKKILFVSGPTKVPDAALRLSAYRDTMEEYHLPVTEDNIAYGDFSDMVDPLVVELLDRNPDAQAIVCANDEMAESTYRVLRQRGLTPGRDILVTGFDDNDGAPFMNPPLTTVRQDLTEVAKIMAEKIRQIRRGEKITSEAIDATLVVRHSCGCMEEIFDRDRPKNEDRHERLAEARAKIKVLQNDNIISSLILRGVLTRGIKAKDFFTRLGHILHRIGLKRSCIAILKEPMYVSHGMKMFVPDELLLTMWQDGAEVYGYSRSKAPVIGSRDIDKYMGGRGGSNQYVAGFPLFSGEYHYGVLFVELRPEEMLFCYTLSLEIGTGIRYLFLELETQEIHKALEEKNQILDYSATHDTLTGLYNRSGAMSRAFSLFRKYKKENHFIAVMADLDHLKQINDSFGHDAGDEAIQKTAEILSKALPEHSVIGRAGGDEFVCFMLEEGSSHAKDFAKLVGKLCEQYNDISEKPYYLGISVGCYSFDANVETSPIEVLKKADQYLYEAKKTRRDNVVR